MGFFDRLKPADINFGVERFQATPGAVLLDVRTGEEYAQGHIPGSRNVDVQDIGRAAELVQDKDTPLFVYCYSGARSSRAVSALRSMGYTNVTNIGGIAGYRGQIEG